MSDAIGILFGNSGSDTLQGLTLQRPIAVFPFGGRFRLLDFALSSMVNSGIRTIGLITPLQFRPMLDHLTAGKDRLLHRKAGGLFILPGAIQGLTQKNANFRIKDLSLNIEYLERDFAENVVISNCNQVFNMNFKDVLKFHRSKQADVTLVYQQSDNSPDRAEELYLGEEQEVLKISKQKNVEIDRLNSTRFVNILIIKRQLLLEIIRGYQSIETAELMDALTENLSTLKVYGFSFNGYIGEIHSVQDYFERSMDLLKQDIRERLLMSSNSIHSKVVDNPPSRYGFNSRVSNSLISNGCTIEGEVENSIISRGVVIESGAKVKNSVILRECVIHAESGLEYVILDKFVEVNEGNILKGKRDNPLVVVKKSAV